jgi:hypothetical protein
MTHPNPLETHGYVVTAIASEIRPGEWRGTFIATKDGANTITEVNLATAASHEEAEQNTLAVARAFLTELAKK